jgi:hypothetical protein
VFISCITIFDHFVNKFVGKYNSSKISSCFQTLGLPVVCVSWPELRDPVVSVLVKMSCSLFELCNPHLVAAGSLIHLLKTRCPGIQNIHACSDLQATI